MLFFKLLESWIEIEIVSRIKTLGHRKCQDIIFELVKHFSVVKMLALKLLKIFQLLKCHFRICSDLVSRLILCRDKSRPPGLVLTDVGKSLSDGSRKPLFINLFNQPFSSTFLSSRKSVVNTSEKGLRIICHKFFPPFSIWAFSEEQDRKLEHQK
jgi:hypothetical protein